MSAPPMSFSPSLVIDEAASYLSSSSAPSKVSNTIKLELYGLFKFLTVAPKPHGSRPSIFDMVGRAKWDAWKSACEVYENNTHAAEQRYLAIARELGWVPRSTPVVGKASEKQSEDGDADGDVWDDSVDAKSSGGGGGGGGMGTSVSSMAYPGPDLGEAQTLHGVAIAGDPEKLNEFLHVNPAANINARDEFGYTALHLACDRGSLGVVQVLLSKGGDPLLKDPDDYTAAELAQVAGHQEIYELLNTTQ
ncbi:ankyrin [Rhizopogon vinicolor AM-OR11-026]|uniref:Ankyrin n=1 Tax=Rhizopogon vinicolor AM-OR11-026 TaxID=1314800 RepID=A0A1B7NH44_9AGAM|nr:ankyrin [Rhizopogon vinicolor AM-OR11-026]